MSITWGDSVRNHDRKQGASSAGATPPAALSQNPLAPSCRDASERPGVGPVHTEQVRPDFECGVWDYIYYILWIATLAVGTGLLIVLFNFWKLGIL